MEGEPNTMIKRGVNSYYLDQPQVSLSTMPSDQNKIFQQSVTLNVYQEGYPRSTVRPIADTGWFVWGITQAQLPILIGTAAGVMVLLITLVGLIVWRCCQFPKGKEDEYCFQREEEGTCNSSNSSTKRMSSESVVFIGHAKHSSCSSHSYLNQCSDYLSSSPIKAPNNSISRSQSAPIKRREQSNWSLKQCSSQFASKKRPQSQPLRISPADVNFSAHLNQIQSSDYCTPANALGSSKLPDIPEIRLCSTETLDSESQASTYSSYGYAPSHCHNYTADSMSATMKTRSLPTWVRSRQRPLSTEDDLSELYAKVSLNKRRKNRMRNDSAAAIALNKSRSQLMHFPFTNDDTDSLVDNEAVVIYDERTAL